MINSYVVLNVIYLREGMMSIHSVRPRPERASGESTDMGYLDMIQVTIRTLNIPSLQL